MFFFKKNEIIKSLVRYAIVKQLNATEELVKIVNLDYYISC
jgi:hypothetical protein